MASVRRCVVKKCVILLHLKLETISGVLFVYHERFERALGREASWRNLLFEFYLQWNLTEWKGALGVWQSALLLSCWTNREDSLVSLNT